MKKETQAHYEQLAAHAHNKELKQLFSLLAASEEQYIAELMKFQSQLTFKTREAYNLDANVCVFSPSINPVDPESSLAGDPDGYMHIVRNEEGNIELFDKLSEQATDDYLRKQLQILARKEREHLDMVENVYQFVEEPRTYLEWGEFSNMKSL
jgi:rubrerythrin